MHIVFYMLCISVSIVNSVGIPKYAQRWMDSYEKDEIDGARLVNNNPPTLMLTERKVLRRLFPGKEEVWVNIIFEESGDDDEFGFGKQPQFEIQDSVYEAIFIGRWTAAYHLKNAISWFLKALELGNNIAQDDGEPHYVVIDVSGASSVSSQSQSQQHQYQDPYSNTFMSQDSYSFQQLPIKTSLRIATTQLQHVNDAQFGNKIILPASLSKAMNQFGSLRRGDDSLSVISCTDILTFKISHLNNNGQTKYTHAGVYEFTSSETHVVLPQFIIETIDAKQNDWVTIEKVILPKGDFVKLQLLKTKDGIALEKSGIDRQLLLQNYLRRFVSMTQGDLLHLQAPIESSSSHDGFGSSPQMLNIVFEVIEVKNILGENVDAICVADQDVNVDFELAKDYNEYMSNQLNDMYDQQRQPIEDQELMERNTLEQQFRQVVDDMKRTGRYTGKRLGDALNHGNGDNNGGDIDTADPNQIIDSQEAMTRMMNDLNPSKQEIRDIGLPHIGMLVAADIRTKLGQKDNWSIGELQQIKQDLLISWRNEAEKQRARRQQQS